MGVTAIPIAVGLGGAAPVTLTLTVTLRPLSEPVAWNGIGTGRHIYSNYKGSARNSADAVRPCCLNQMTPEPKQYDLTRLEALTGNENRRTAPRHGVRQMDTYAAQGTRKNAYRHLNLPADWPPPEEPR